MPKFSLPALSLALGLAVISAGFLTAVVTAPTAPSGPCVAPYGPGKASALVSIVNQANGEPGVSFPTPLKTTGPQLSILAEGSGRPAYAGGYIDFDVTVFLGENLEFLTSSPYDPNNPLRRAIDPAGEDFFAAALECATPGSRLALTATVEDMFGTISEDDQIKNASTIVAIVDVHDTFPQRAYGSTRLAQSGLPTVVNTPEGVHGLSFPNAPIPTELRVSVLKQGTGVGIQDGSLVTAHFTGAVWNTRKIFASSFERELPLLLLVTDQRNTADGNGVIPGLAQALIGKTVGSQVLISVPPELGYLPGQAPFGVPEGATLVYVFDILGVTQ